MPSPVNRPAFPERRLSAAWRLACLALLAGMFMKFIGESFITPYFTRAKTEMRGDREVYAEVDWSKLPAVARWNGRLATLLMMGSGFLVLGAARRLRPARAYVPLFVALWLWSLWLLMGPTAHPRAILTTMQVFANMAPGTLMVLSVFFLGMNPQTWPFVRRGLMWLVVLACVFFVGLALQMSAPTRREAFRFVHVPTLVLELLAFLPVGLTAGSRGFKRMAACLPPFLLAAAAVVTQTRLTLIMLLVLTFVYIGTARAGGIPGRQRRTQHAVFTSMLVALLIGGVLTLGWDAWLKQTTLGQAATGFWERRYEDTRSVQFSFFDEVPLKTLVTGAGYPAEGEYTSEGEGGIDCGYINVLYVGGIPMALLLILLVTIPPLRASRLRLSDADAAIVACGVAFALRMASSTVPTLNTQVLIAALVAGRCAWLLAAHKAAGRDPRRVGEPGVAPASGGAGIP